MVQISVSKYIYLAGFKRFMTD